MKEFLAQTGAPVAVPSGIAHSHWWVSTFPLVGHGLLPTHPKDNTSTFILLCTTFFYSFKDHSHTFAPYQLLWSLAVLGMGLCYWSAPANPFPKVPVP